MRSRRAFTSLRIGAAALSFVVSACTGVTAPYLGSDPATEKYAAGLGVDITQMTKKSDALYVQDLVVGTGAEPLYGNVLTVTYTGWLVNGIQFDSNVGKGAFTFTLGNHAVIDGWDLGILGMKAGGKRRMVLGSRLGYGAKGYPPGIPPDATLIFDVQLLTVK